jgi:hypothetical protein
VTRLSPVQEQAFQAWVRSTQWFRDYVAKWQEQPNFDDPDYDYRAAWLAGVAPEYQPDYGEYHWADQTPEGQWLKSETHPTRWVGEFYNRFGYDPVVAGISKERAAEMMAQPPRRTGGGLLRAVIRRMLAAHRTMGMGRVEAVVRPGEVRLENRPERVVVAGNVTPAIGTEIPWVAANTDLLVATYNLPMGMPAPTSVLSPTIPIYLSAELLYGDNLEVGYYCYAASFLAEEGATEVSPWVDWIQTKQVADPPSMAVGHFIQGGNWPLGWWEFKQTIFKADGTGGDGETTVSSPFSSWEATVGWRTLRLGYGDLAHSLRNATGFRAYARPGHWIPGIPYQIWVPDGPFRRIAEKAGREPVYVDISEPSFGPEPPDESTLSARRAGLNITVDEDAASLYYTQMALYRSIAQEAPSWPPEIGRVGEVAVPLPAPPLDPLDWIDYTGPASGDPPPFPFGGGS